MKGYFKPGIKISPRVTVMRMYENFYVHNFSVYICPLLPDVSLEALFEAYKLIIAYFCPIEKGR